jgi:hypothetical protein
MRISLDSPIKKVGMLLVAVLAASFYLVLTATAFLAAHFSEKPELADLQKAVHLEPGNAEYRYLLGRYFWLVQHSPDQAVAAYRDAVRLNPHQARYWLDLAGAYQLLGNTNEQRDALEHAILAGPTTPEVAWEAANLYIVEGETDKALAQFRVVLESDPYLPGSALELCWRIKPDVDVLLRDVVPPLATVDVAFLDLLASKKETAAAAKVWAHLAQLHQPVEKRYVFNYLGYLIAQQQVDQARLVWQQAGYLSGLSAYQPTSENLVVNGDFSLDILNGGFDWLYRRSPEVSLAFDPTQPHSGNRSLSIVFNSAAINDAGILQIIPVQPNTNYEFSANFKAESIEGAGGPQFVIQDFYTGAAYFSSEDLKDADFWKQTGGDFLTGPDTRLLLLHIARVPPRSPIKGRLWIDGVHLGAKPQPG